VQLNDVGLLVTSTTSPEGDYEVISVAAASDTERVDELRAVFSDQNVEIDDALATELVALVDDSYYWAPMLFRLMADGVVTETWSAEGRRWTWALADGAATVVDPESGLEREDPLATVLTGRLPDFGELLDGVMEDNIPQALQPILRVGSLMSEPFPLEVAMRVAQPGCTPAMIDHAWDAMVVAASEGTVVRVVLTRSSDRLLRFSHPDHKTRLELNFVGKDRRHTHDRIADEFDARLRAHLSPEAEIGTWRAVAHHRAQADGLRSAALAFRRAAELAEAQLDGSAARKCYREAARLLSRCLADGDETGAEINELLLLVNTSYRMARLARLTDDIDGAGDAASDDRQDDRRRRDALRYLDQLEGRLTQPGALPIRFDVDNDEVPMPDPLRHVTRVVHALRGYVLFEQAMGHRDNDQQAKAIDGMLDALHHADRAADEGQGRWLVGAATARYADLLTDAAIDAHDDGLQRRCDSLSTDALFNIERVLGLTGSTPEDTAAIEQAKRWARATQLRIYQHVHDDPDAVEALARLHQTPQTRSPLADVLSARLTTAMIELSELTGADRSRCDRLHDEFDLIAAESDELGLSRLVPRAAYGRALVDCIIGDAVTAVANVDLSQLRPRWRHRIELFNKLFASTAEVGSLDEDTERRALYRLIHDAPALAPAIEARLAGNVDGAVSGAIKRANDYVSRTGLKTATISFDALIWRLAPARLPDHVLQHCLDVRDRADQLLAVHTNALGGLDQRDIARDLAVAAAVHDWYRDAEPARLRTLAREWNIPINGSAWANPTLLHGPLAVFVMEHQYGARKLLGNERFDRLREMVEAHTIGAESASPAAQIFFLADSMANGANRPQPGQPQPRWCEMAMQPGRLRDAYERAVCAKVERAQLAGRVLTQSCRWALDLHPAP
jgi:HD superfamily phosphohydrolase YqeK